MAAPNPIGQITNLKNVVHAQMSGQQQLRQLENQDFNPNAIQHSNPSIKDPGSIISENTAGLKSELGSDLNLQTKLNTQQNQLNLLA